MGSRESQTLTEATALMTSVSLSLLRSANDCLCHASLPRCDFWFLNLPLRCARQYSATPGMQSRDRNRAGDECGKPCLFSVLVFEPTRTWHHRQFFNVQVRTFLLPDEEWLSLEVLCHRPHEWFLWLHKMLASVHPSAPHFTSDSLWVSLWLTVCLLGMRPVLLTVGRSNRGRIWVL